MAADVIPTASPRTTGVWRGATAATAEVLTRPWRPYRRYEDLDVGLGAVPLGSSRRVANVSCARRSFTACEARFELEQQRPVTERSLAVQSADILAHHTPEALTNLLIEVSVKVLVRSTTSQFGDHLSQSVGLRGLYSSLRAGDRAAKVGIAARRGVEHAATFEAG